MIAASDADAATKLTAFIRFHLNSLVDHLDLYSLTFREESELPDDVRDEFRAAKREHDVLIRQIIREGVEARIFEPIDETLAAFAITACATGSGSGIAREKTVNPLTTSPRPSPNFSARSHDDHVDGVRRLARKRQGVDGALAYHAREMRHHTSQLELLLRNR